MDKISIYRGHIKRFYNKIKSPNTCPSKKCKLIQSIENISLKYLAALAYDDSIEWQSFYNIVDILHDNIQYIKEQIKQ